MYICGPSLATIIQDKIHLNILDSFPCAYIYNCAREDHVRSKNTAVFAYGVTEITNISRNYFEYFKKNDVM